MELKDNGQTIELILTNEERATLDRYNANPFSLSLAQEIQDWFELRASQFLLDDATSFKRKYDNLSSEEQATVVAILDKAV